MYHLGIRLEHTTVLGGTTDAWEVGYAHAGACKHHMLGNEHHMLGIEHLMTCDAPVMRLTGLISG
jgi:hypothetical protein